MYNILANQRCSLKILTLFSSTVVASSIGIKTFAQTSPTSAVPVEAVKMLAAREQHWSSKTFDWKVKHVTVYPAASAKILEAIATSITESTRKEQLARGVTSSREIDDLTRRRVQASAENMRGSTLQFDNLWQIASHRDEIVASGTIATGIENPTYQTIYRDKVGMESVQATDRKQESLSSLSITVWGTSQKAWNHLNPSQQGLWLKPEDFALLAGKNPLALHGVQWNLKSATPKAWIIEAWVTQGPFAPYTVRQELDREHGGVPSKITMTSKVQHWKSEYTVDEFKLSDGKWIPQKVSSFWDHYVWNETATVHHERTWNLVGISETQALPSLPAGRTVNDTRLLGSDITGNQLMEVLGGSDPKLIRYNSDNGLKSEEELREMAKGRKPLVKTGAGLPAGALLLTVGIVWSGRRRRAAKR